MNGRVKIKDKGMNILVACETSGKVRRAFRELGHNGRFLKLRSVTYDGIAKAMANQWG